LVRNFTHPPNPPRNEAPHSKIQIPLRAHRVNLAEIAADAVKNGRIDRQPIIKDIDNWHFQARERHFWQARRRRRPLVQSIA
jgi:hypothetical protein